MSSTVEPDRNEIDTQMLYVAQQRLDGYTEAVKHAVDRKRTFDKRVLESRAGQVTFHPGQLVQVYRSELLHTMSSDRKLVPKWSQPHRVVQKIRNSYLLETRDGSPIAGEVHARRLREFIPRPGTQLAKEQQEFMQKITTAMIVRPKPRPPEISNTDEKAERDKGAWHLFGEQVEDEIEDGESSVEDEDDSDLSIAQRRGRRHFLKGALGVGVLSQAL
jgi:hypothetical protein